MRKIFFFSYYFVPFKAIGAIRLHAIATGFQKLGYKVLVNSSKNALRTERQELDVSELDVKYRPTFDFKTIQFLLSKRKQNFKTKSTQKSITKKLSFRWLNAFPLNLIIGEGGLIYILATFSKSIFRVKSGDILFSSFSPYSDHFIAYLLKLLKPQLFWICDFRDLHLNPGEEGNIVFFRFNKWVNKIIIRKADIVTSVSDGVTRHLKEYNSNVYTLRNGIHPELEQKMSSFEVKDIESSVFKITYTGGLYSGRRDPSVLFESLAELINEDKIKFEKIKLVYAGKDGKLWENFASNFALKELVENKGMVSLEESLRIQKTANVNILLTWATPKLQGILTGKFYEYLLADRPIALIINGVEDKEFEEIANELNIGEVAYNSEPSKLRLKAFILKNYQEWELSGYNKNQLKRDVLERYKWSNILSEFNSKITQDRGNGINF